MSEPRRLCKTCGRNRAERFFRGARGRVCVDCQKHSRSKATHARRVGEVYGLRPGEYEALLAAQDGVCAICKMPRRYRLNVDHDHRVEREALAAGAPPEVAARAAVRGLLCRRCNGRLLPACLDDPAILRSAIDYLTNPPVERLAA